jgi:hypothetical protein
MNEMPVADSDLEPWWGLTAGKAAARGVKVSR